MDQHFHQSDTVGGRNREPDSKYLDVQTLCVNLGITDEERANQAMDAVNERLKGRGGYRDLAPRIKPGTTSPPRTNAFRPCPGKGSAVAFLPWKGPGRLIHFLVGIVEMRRLKFVGNSAPPITPGECRIEPCVPADFVKRYFTRPTPVAPWVDHVQVQDDPGVQPGWQAVILQPRLSSSRGEVEIRRRLRGVSYETEIEEQPGDRG